jgi:hypothetical protein
MAAIQIQSIGLLVGAAGVVCLLLLFAGGTDDRWFAQTRARIRRSRPVAAPSDPLREEGAREHEERVNIETRMERERAREALREPD